MRLDRVAAAPISWGVCEVPGWGHQMDADQVLGQMSGLGLAATELGPAGFLPDLPTAKAHLLRAYGLRAVGGFLPLVLHDGEHDPLPAFDAYLQACVESEAAVVVLAAASGGNGYDRRPALDDAGWTTLLDSLDSLAAYAAARGVVATLHPHVGTMVETRADVERVLVGCGVGLCLDTGHLLVGGTDPQRLATRHPDRVAHVHLKDVDAAMAARVLADELAFGDAVRGGLFRPLGDGDVDIAAVVRTLEGAGYAGWYVLEQDVMLPGPDPEGPRSDVARCLDYLRAVQA